MLSTFMCLKESGDFKLFKLFKFLSFKLYFMTAIPCRETALWVG